MPVTRILPVIALMLTPLVAEAQRVDVFADPENLQVLPEDISSTELSATMRGFAMGLGVRCETCHVGEAGQPLETFDFASDEKAMKQKARLMLTMLMEINAELIPRLDEVETASRVEVRCMTCHRGRPQPKLIEDVMDEVLIADGIDAALARYRELRQEFYGAHSYDFSEFVLPMYAQRLFGSGEPGAAIAFSETNAEFFPDSYYTAFVLGELYSATDQTQEAIESFSRAIELNPRAEAMLNPRIDALQSD